MDMKKMRDQARKENNALKSKAKGKTKAVKAVAATVVDSVVAANVATSKKTAEMKDSVVRAVQTTKENMKAGAKRMGKISHDIGPGPGKIVDGIKHTTPNVPEKRKHH